MLRVVDTRDQGSSQGKFSSFVSVARREYAKAFEVTVDMLDTCPPLGEFRIGAFLLRAQLVFFRTLFGKRTLGMQLGQTGIASVGENQGVAGKRQSAVLEQLLIFALFAPGNSFRVIHRQENSKIKNMNCWLDDTIPNSYLVVEQVYCRLRIVHASGADNGRRTP